MPAEPSCAARRSHAHAFHEANPLAERRLGWVVALTATMMVVEIAAGWIFNSMALLADGWHMGSHVIALGLSAAAYTLARRLAQDDRFAFGTWKIEVLAGYTSAVLLVGVAGYMIYESISRLLKPTAIDFNHAIAVAIVGLLVNLLSAWLLAGAHPHGGDHVHEHGGGEQDHHHTDLNMRSAIVHVAADAATSVLAIAALFGGKYLGTAWLDPVMGLIGAALVAGWAAGLLKDTGRILLDAEMDAPIVSEIRAALRDGPIPAELHDLHVWRVGKGKYACVLGITTGEPASPDDFRAILAKHPELAHVTVEINRAVKAR